MSDPSARRTRSLRAGLAVTAVMVTVTGAFGVVGPLASPAAAAGAGEQARSVHDFLNSLGVNVHMSYGGTRYGDSATTLDALQTLGITHVRENFRPGNDSELARLQALRDGGIRFDFVVPRPTEPYGDNPAASVGPIAQDFAGATDAIEAPNEYDHGQLPGWNDALRITQSGLRAAGAATPGLAGVPLFGPSLLNFRLARDAPLVGDLSADLDFGNVHSYPGGQMPETGITQQMDLYAQYISAGKPVVATETGYHNAVHNTHPSGHPSTTETTAAIYLPRLFLEYFRVGVTRTYTYELFDEGTSDDQEDHFGLFEVDGTPKPAAKAIGNLTAILADGSTGGASDGGGTLAYSLGDTADPSDVHHVLLQKSDGTFYLALWRAESVAVPGAGSDAPQDSVPAARPVTVSFDQPVSGAQSYLPSVGTDPQNTWAAPQQLSVDVGPDVTLLKIVPDGVQPSPDGSASGPEPSPAVSTDPADASTDPNTSASPLPGDASATPTPDAPSDTPSADPTADPTPAPSPGESADTTTYDEYPWTDGHAVLRFPMPGSTNRYPIAVTQRLRLVAPETAVPMRTWHFQVDGVVLTDDVLDPAALASGHHEVRMVGWMPDGQRVVSMRLVSVERESDGPTTPLIALVAGLLLAHATVTRWVRRRRRNSLE